MSKEFKLQRKGSTLKDKEITSTYSRNVAASNMVWFGYVFLGYLEKGGKRGHLFVSEGNPEESCCKVIND
jgi:hypothetical protein